jgi:hypothetical protein
MTDTLERIARELLAEHDRSEIACGNGMACKLWDVLRAELANRGAGRPVNPYNDGFADGSCREESCIAATERRSAVVYIDRQELRSAFHDGYHIGELDMLDRIRRNQPSDALKPERKCDYAHLATDRQHGPVAKTKGGYHICQACYDGIIEAERSEQAAYDTAFAKEQRMKPEATEKAETARERAHRILDAVIDVPEHFGPSLVQAIAAAKVEKGE